MPAKQTTIQVQEDATPAQVLLRFRVVFNAVRGHFRDMEKKVGVGGAQVWALSLIRATPGIGINGLANSMQIHQSTASNLIKALQKRELIQINKSALDRRNVEIRILPAGNALLRRVPGPMEGVLPKALGGLEPPTLKRLNQDLHALIVLLKADEATQILL